MNRRKFVTRGSLLGFVSAAPAICGPAVAQRKKGNLRPRTEPYGRFYAYGSHLDEWRESEL
jgi:hypothetical protein